MSFEGHYLGFGSLETLLKETGAGKLYADCLSTSEPAQMGLENRNSFIQVACLDADTTCFWRWPLASVLYSSSGPMDDEKAQRASAASDSAWPAILEWLKAQGCRVIEACPAFPRGRNYLDGQRPEFLEHDPKTGRYSLKEAIHAG
jgi:hypothetical protein